MTEWIANCEVCQRSKGEHVPTPGLLQPIPIPNQTWQVITMDFIEGLPKSEGKDTILVVVRLLRVVISLPSHTLSQQLKWLKWCKLSYLKPTK